jgi:hypothetical protein
MLATTSVRNVLYVKIESWWYITVFSLVVFVGVKLVLSHWEKPGAEENVCTYQILLEEMGAPGMWKHWMGEFHLNVRSDNLKERDHFDDIAAGDRIILKCVFKEQD